jgi:hypothetical protein
MFNYFFCNGGPIAEAAGCGDHVKSVRFKWADLRSDEHGFESEQKCRI